MIIHSRLLGIDSVAVIVGIIIILNLIIKRKDVFNKTTKLNLAYILLRSYFIFWIIPILLKKKKSLYKKIN